jgi:hypothetical protein
MSLSWFGGSTKNPVATGSGVYKMFKNKFKPQPLGRFPEAPVPALVGVSKLPSTGNVPAALGQVNRFSPTAFATNTVYGKA